MRPSDLSPERWREVDRLFAAALERPPDERGAFVARECGSDDALRAHLAALLRVMNRSGEYFATPIDLDDLGIASPQGEESITGRPMGPFTLLHELGRGGMSVVYLAEDTRLGRPVAIKVLPPYLGVGPEARRRFESEARAVSALDHPNIATLHEVGQTDDGQPFMVFSAYEGETLAARIERGPLDTDEILDIAVGITSGLAAAHDHGIVHRDVKPSNVMITVGGAVKLLDFGVAKGPGQEITAEGVRLGTVAYMSPEQVAGRPIDARSDLWSVGIVLSEMATGRRPFHGDDYQALSQAILVDTPDSWPEMDLASVGHLPEVTRALLSKDVDARYPSAQALLQDLEAMSRGEEPSFVRGSSAAAPSAPRPRRTRRIAAAVAIAIAAAVGWPLSQLGNAPVERVAVMAQPSSSDGNEPYLLGGLTRALATELGRAGQLSVVSSGGDAPGREGALAANTVGPLGFDAVVRTELRTERDSLRLTVRLEVASEEDSIWVGTYEGLVAELYVVATRAATAILEELRVELTPSERLRLATPAPSDPRVNQAIVFGHYHRNRRTPADVALARQYFQRAIVLDSTSARAHAGLAGTYATAAAWGFEGPHEAYPRARQLAVTAMGLDSLLAEAHATLAAVALRYDWDWAVGESLARRAVELNASSLEGHRLLEAALRATGRYGDAQRVAETADALEPWPIEALMGKAFRSYETGQLEDVLVSANAAADFDPDIWQASMLTGLASAELGSFDQAITASERAVERSSRTPTALSALGYVYARAGRRDEALAVAMELENGRQAAVVPASRIAIVYGATGELDPAFEWLDRAFEERDPTLVQIRSYPFFDPLRGDPRFEELLARMQLIPPGRVGTDAR